MMEQSEHPCTNCLTNLEVITGYIESVEFTGNLVDTPAQDSQRHWLVSVVPLWTIELGFR